MAMVGIKKGLRGAKSQLRRIRQSDFYWRYVSNCKPWRSYKLDRTHLNDRQRLLLRVLRRDGIALTTVKELMTDSLFDHLENAVWSLEKTTLAEVLPQAREQSNAPGFK